jgi:outer membrane lipoprotein-sorting protein
MPKVIASASTPKPSQSISETTARTSGTTEVRVWLRRRRLAGLAIATICALAAADPCPASAQQPLPSPSLQTALDPAEAKALLMRMSEYLAKAPGFSVNLDAGYDVVQASGQKIEFGQTRRLLLQRPNRLRISVTQSSGARQEVFYNGSELVLFDPRENVFVSLPSITSAFFASGVSDARRLGGRVARATKR